MVDNRNGHIKSMLRIIHCIKSSYTCITFAMLIIALTCACAQRPHHTHRALNTLLFMDNFEAQANNLAPRSWQFIRGLWRVVGKEDHLLKQLQTDAELAVYAIATWQNYTISTRFKVMHGIGNWGVGVVGYWRDVSNHYRFFANAQNAYLVKVVDGHAKVLAQAKYSMIPNVWYRAKLQVANGDGYVELRGKLWMARRNEPREWTLMVRDENPHCTSGLAGFWTGHCDAAFGEIAIVSNVDETREQSTLPVLYSSDFQTDRKGESPSGFITFGGKWIIDREAGMRVCRQLEDETPLSFNENAYAIVQWRNYTVRVRMRADRARTVWGYGIVGYYTLDDTGEHFYRLWQARGVVMLDKRDGKRTDHFGSAPLRCERGKWYTFLMRLQEEEGGVLIRAKVWDDGPEPKDWLLEHYDPKPLAGGQAGILVFRAECSFDDFTVLRNSGTSRFRTVVLQNHWGGYEGCEEVGVISSASPDANQRNSPIFRITRKDGTVTRGLLHFDLSVLPAGGIVRRATLMLYALRREGEPTVGVFRLLKRWLPDRVTWLSPDGRRRWDTPGGDFPGDGNNPAHLSFQPGSQYGEESAVKITHAPRWWAFDITEAVRSWVEGAVANYGLVLTIVEGNGMVEFATSRITSTETSIAPRLFIEYEVRQPLEPWHSPLEYWQAVMQRKGLLTGPPRGFYPNGIMGEYYDDPDAKEYQMDKEPPGPVFTKLIFTRSDEMINFVWNTGRAPHPEMGSEFWSVRWQGRLFVPRDDEYKFYFDNLDDAARLYIDGKLILDAWKIQLPSTHASEPIKLTAGFHQVVVEYHQGPGPGAAIRLSWSGTNLPKQVVVFPEGIKGDYYDDPAYNEYELNQPPPGPFFQRHVFSRVDVTIDFDWNTCPHPEMTSQYWSVRWHGQLLVPEDGEYIFYLEDLDDAARLKVDGKLIIDEWRIGKPRNAVSQPVRLSKGLHEFVLEYHQGPAPLASIRVSWQGPSFAKEVIPPCTYFPRNAVERLVEEARRKEVKAEEIATAKVESSNVKRTQATTDKREVEPMDGNEQ